MVSADEELLLKLTSPMLSYGHSNGLVEGKDEFIASLLSAKYNFLTIDLKQQTIRLTGNIAIVRHELHADTEDLGKPERSIKLHVLMVWKKSSLGWELVARQAVKM